LNYFYNYLVQLAFPNDNVYDMKMKTDHSTFLIRAKKFPNTVLTHSDFTEPAGYVHSNKDIRIIK